jgi:hypothetical protein
MRETDSPNLQNPYRQKRMIDTIVIILLTLGGTFMHRQIVKDWAAMVLPFLRDKND